MVTVLNDYTWIPFFLHADDALSRTRRLINTWKTGFTTKASQCSGDLYWIKPWIETFWSTYSGTHYTVPTDWIWTFSTCSRCPTKDQKIPQHLEKWFHRKGNSVFWPWYWITPLIHTFWGHCSGIWSWLAPPEYQSTHGICCTTDHKTLRNVEPSIAMNINWYSGHFQWINPWLHTFLPSGTEWKLIPPGHPFAHDRCSSKDQKTPQHSNNWLCHNGMSMFWPFIVLYWIKPWIQTFWTNCDSTHYWLTPSGRFLTHERWPTKEQKAPQHLKNRFCHQGESVFWPFILNQASPNWLHGWTGILVEPVRTVCHCSGLRKCVFMVWSSNYGQKIKLSSRWNHFSRCRVFWLMDAPCIALSINQSISTNHLHKNDQWLTNKVKNNKTKIKPNE